MRWWRSPPNAKTVSSSRSKQRSMQILFGLLVSPSPLKYGESTSWVSCLGHQEDLDSYLSQSTHSPSGWKLCQWWISHKKQWSSSYKASYIGSAYPDGFWQIMGLSSKEQSLWDAMPTMVSTISRHQQRILRRMGRSNEWTCLFYKGQRQECSMT
jgi:hypothetical protein